MLSYPAGPGLTTCVLKHGDAVPSGFERCDSGRQEMAAWKGFSTPLLVLRRGTGWETGERPLGAKGRLSRQPARKR